MLEKSDTNTRESRSMRLADTVGKLYFGIAELQLYTGKAFVYKNDLEPETVGRLCPWNEMLTGKLSLIYPADREELIRKLSLESLSSVLALGKTELHLELRTQWRDEMPSWVEIEASVISYEDRRFLITARNIAEQRLLENIVRLYVYRNCDYFIYLDIKNNRYKMLWKQDTEETVPAAYSDDYRKEFHTYIHTYVAPEDRENMEQEILPEHILAELEKANVHTYYYGLLDPVRGYTRKRLQFLYYDKATQTMLITRTDVTDLYLDSERHNKELEQAIHQSQIDQLTGVYNHTAIELLICEALADRRRNKGALLFIDLDDFKLVNDIQGHQRGDDLLRHVAQALRRALRAEDLVGRVGGDEFIAFLVNVSARTEVEQCADRLRKAIAQFENRTMLVTCSIGIALYPEDGKDFATLYNHADRAMYQAKAEGKARYASWDAEIP